MIKIHKIVPIYFKQQKKIIFFNQNSLNNFRLLSSKSSNQQQKNRKPHDEEIKSQYIRYVNLEGQLQGTYPLKKILSTFDRKKYLLIQVSPVNTASSTKDSQHYKRHHEQQQEAPICKLVSKEEIYKQNKQKKSTTLHMLKKELKLTWKVSPNDLTHKLSRSKEWLEKGYQLRVVISNKDKKSRLNKEDKNILDRIIKELSGFAKEVKEPKWTGDSVTLEIQAETKTQNATTIL
ncbi:hypothetical protein C1645_735075 [Glomus cerebriforme]|uniref:Translation initiation factor 3 C-terminal domain-containing protein n=1 Tax=Glomus cerebriforme TaxID=658196 RepID=A0A397T6X6_9GLOM|nr:hypothetical protein C1645_735075 [Glomus cerebriforme]